MPGNVRYASYGANNSNAPSRTKSLDCLADKSDKTDEYVPSRITRMAPKANETAMQFVKTGPANLYKTATEQIKKAEAVKAMRKHLIAEEEEWQENLDKWKSSRRKRNEEALERVIEIKKNEQEEEFSRTRRKSKTFSEMREDKTKRGRRYNLVVHDDDNNDLADLGLSSAKSTSSLNDPHEENDVKDLDQDNKDAKSDAGFCTGSDTGSDGVFAEDNISDTSSALGDKKEAHDSLLDSGLTKDDEPHLNGHGSGLTTDILQANTSIISSDEYTYDKAIEGYKQYAENSAKRRTSSITSLNSNTSYTKDDERKDEKFRLNNRSPSPVKINKLDDKLNYFSREMENQFRSSPEPKVVMREKSPKVDIGKRRSMFEMHESVSVQCTKQKQVHRRSLDVSNSLRNKVASFENLETETPRARSITPNRDTNLRSKVASFENLEAQTPKVRGITPPRDAKFHEKLATFSSSEIESQPVHKKTPERDVNFHKKLASFTSIENGEEDKVRERKTIPARDPMLKNKIASFEQLEQAAEVSKPAPVEVPQKSRERSVSLENLDEPQVKEVNAQVFEIASKLEETPLVGSPVLKAPTLPLPVPPTQEEDSLETSKPYTDDDINEVISDYEQVGGSYEDSSDHAENIYENITDEPMYENIYEKVNDENNSNSESEPLNEPHHYQTLEEVREEVKATAAEEFKALPSPEPPAPLPQAPVAEPPVVEAPEVLDVTWTDGPSSQAAPPSEPPPPPPPDDDSDEDASDQLQSLPAQEEDAAFTRENSTRRIKKEIWRRRSDFLGTSSQYIEEEPTVKPPPDLSEFLRKEREVDRVLLESQQSKISNKEVLNEEEINRREREIIESLERSEQLQKEQQQSKYVWEDPAQQSDVTAEDMSDADEHLQYQMKLAELEEEMMRHDKDMLQRAGKLPSSAPAPQSGHIPPPSLYASQEEASPNASIEEGSFNYPAKPTSLPLQEFYTAPTFGGSSPPTTLPLDGSAVDVSPGQMVVSSPSGSPSQYSTLASPHPFNRSHSQNSIGGAPIHAPLQGVRSSPMSAQRDPAPEPLPRKKKLPPPPPNKPQSDLNTVERLEAIRLSRMPTSDVSVGAPDQPETQGPSVSPSGQQMSKQTLLALSAIPKPRLTDNESWITKKKPEARRDYSKHWLHQEAEQRRLEQQDRINRYKTAVSQPQLPASQPTTPHCTSPQHPSPSQTAFHPSQTTFIPQNTTPTYSSYPQSLKNPSLSQVNNSNNNNNNNNNSWRNQATTYQPPMPAPTPTGDKALPDSIIHNLTQRVNNKNNKNTYNNNNNNNGRLGNSYGNNYRDENYHDYMNADALSSPSSHAPLYQSGTGPGQPSPPSTQPDPPNAQDQRLLSVSGKKKCSHCSEELGRGAAMIIESLRLFYHIPCFKCCVCGIQLGNGSAGADVRVRNHKLHCHNCYSNDEGMKFSKV